MPAAKLTPEVRDAICKLIAEEGLFRKDAGAIHGIDERSITRWFTRGSTEERGPYRSFYLGVIEAEAKFKQSLHTSITSSSKINPKAAQWLMSRRFPSDYGRHDNVETIAPEEQAATSAALRRQLFDRLERLFPPKKPDVTPPAEGSNAPT